MNDFSSKRCCRKAELDSGNDRQTASFGGDSGRCQRVRKRKARSVRAFNRNRLRADAMVQELPSQDTGSRMVLQNATVLSELEAGVHMQMQRMQYS